MGTALTRRYSADPLWLPAADLSATAP